MLYPLSYGRVWRSKAQCTRTFRQGAGLRLHERRKFLRAQCATSCKSRTGPTVSDFIRIHRTLRVSPAMAAGVTTRLFDVMDLVDLLIESQREKAA